MSRAGYPTNKWSVPTVGFQRFLVVPICSHVFPRAVSLYLSIRFHVRILGHHPWKPLWKTHGNPREQSMETWVQSMETFGNHPWKPLDETWMKLSRNFDKTFMELWSKFHESFIKVPWKFPWIVPKGFHGLFPRIVTWEHVKRNQAIGNMWKLW